MELNALDRQILAGLEGGLGLMDRPYAALASEIGCPEAILRERLQDLLDSGVIKRMGLVVRHHELGYRANAMVVWDIEDEKVGEIAGLLASEPAVTLCYRRPRQLPDWPYNLFCMIHGRARDEVLSILDGIIERHDLTHITHDVLFSKRRFKQRGARYCRPEVASCL